MSEQLNEQHYVIFTNKLKHCCSLIHILLYE